MNLYDIVQRSQRAAIKLAYRLKHGIEKRERTRNHLTFLIRCRNNQLIPRGLTIKLPLKLHNCQKIALRTSNAMLRQLISNTRRKRAQLESEVDTATTELKEMLTPDQWTKLQSWCKNLLTR